MNPAELNIVVVEDDDFQRRMLVRMLRGLGVHSVSEAGNGKEGLAIIIQAAVPIDIALCDLNMPEMDGMEFLRHLGREHRNVAVAIISALDSKLLGIVVRMTKLYGILLLGALEKPILPEQLRELLAKYTRRPTGPPRAVDMEFMLDDVLRAVHARQFEPYYQPKMDFQTGQIVGAEALARWMHPTLGVIDPYAFIPLLEENKTINELTFQMTEKAAVACHTIRSSGYPITISVNLSATSLDDATLADAMTQLVRKAGGEPQHMVLEITESAAMTNVAQALENLARLCMNGFTLSIDDYGTGYASLQQLTRIDVSELKIDQSFVKDFAENEASRIVVQSSIEMAHRLHVKSVAEGVETQVDWDTLKEAGCDVAQGYFIARPMDFAALRDFCVAHSAPVGIQESPSKISPTGIAPPHRY